MRLPLLLVSLTAAFVAASFAGPAGAAVTICHDQASVPLNVAGAAKGLAVVGGKVTPFGAARAQALAGSFRNGGGDVCSLPATAAVQAQLAVIQRLASSGQTAASRALFRKLLAQIAARPSRNTAARQPAAAKGTPCPADKKVKVKLKDADKVGDYLKAAAAAQRAGDQAGAAAAAAAAQAAYETWATGDKTGASTVGDYIALAQGSMKLSGEAGATAALLDKARQTAATDLTKASKVDRCTASVKDADCLGSAEAMAELVGASDSLDVAAAQEIMSAIQDRLEHKTPPDGCEEWSFTMKIVDHDSSDWTIVWGPGRFRVNRKAGTLDASQLAGYGPGWPGIIGALNGECIETTPDGTTDYGPVSMAGVGFHYAIDGTVTDTGFELNISSSDAHASINAPSEPICQGLAQLGQEFVNTIVDGPFPIDFDLAGGQTSATYSESDDSLDISATITRIAPAA
ncbi:MAG TPA: hypothetical protein VMT59_12550 [Gaiellaceae bacterium]|nr:hypothetical protein [Gaiellaceae bacterium]